MTQMISTLKSFAPPRLDTYYQESDFVFVSQLHKEEERFKNIRLARFLGENTQNIVYVLPHIQPTQKNAEKLRKEYFPLGVKNNKNPDFYFRKRFVDGKSMIGIETTDAKTMKHKIQKRLKDAFEQADDAFLEIPTTIPIELVKDAVYGKLSSSKHHHIVYIKYSDELLIIEWKIKQPRKSRAEGGRSLFQGSNQLQRYNIILNKQ